MSQTRIILAPCKYFRFACLILPIFNIVRVDQGILQYMVESQSDFIMEVTDKTKADVKGGTLIDYKGSVRLLEIAQVPSEHVEDFKAVRKCDLRHALNHQPINDAWLHSPGYSTPPVDTQDLERDSRTSHCRQVSKLIPS